MQMYKYIIYASNLYEHKRGTIAKLKIVIIIRSRSSIFYDFQRVMAGKESNS